MTSNTTVLWGAKGGVGTTTVAATIALSDPRPTTLIDLDGDLPALLGLPEPTGPGLTDWLATTESAAALDELTLEVGPTTRVLPRGGQPLTDSPDRWHGLTRWAEAHGPVVVDAGTGRPSPHVTDGANKVLVTRACYLALRRAIAEPRDVDGVILVTEQGRALHSRDVEAALGARVIAEVPVDPSIARAIDAGLLASRIPRTLQRNLEPAVALNVADPEVPQQQETPRGAAAAFPAATSQMTRFDDRAGITPAARGIEAPGLG